MKIYLLALAICGCIEGGGGSEVASAEALDEGPAPCTPGSFAHGPFLGITEPNINGVWATITIPAECENVEIKAWGDGGGPGIDIYGRKTGGGGAFAYLWMQNDHPLTHDLRIRLGGWAGLGPENI